MTGLELISDKLHILEGTISVSENNGLRTAAKRQWSNGINKCFPIIMFCLFIGTAQGQSQSTSRWTNELTFSSANDAFVIWQNSDRFYSFGLGLNLKFKTEKLLGLQGLFSQKCDYFFEAGIRMEGYTPTDKRVSQLEIEEHRISFDRPYAGLLFGKFSTTYAFDRSYLKGGLLVGVVGPSSLAGIFQDWFHHNITNDPKFDEWRYQVPNQLIFNVDFTYTHDFLPARKWFDIYGSMNARLGNLYIDASPTLGLRLGKFNKLTQSLGMENSILSNPGDWELFLQSTIGGSLNIFDATAQGNLFRQDFQFAVNDLKTINAQTTQSLYFSLRRFSLGIEHYFVFGKVVPNERHVYARIVFKYRF